MDEEKCIAFLQCLCCEHCSCIVLMVRHCMLNIAMIFFSLLQVSALKKDLKAEKIKDSMSKTGEAISMAFLKANVRLIGKDWFIY